MEKSDVTAVDDVTTDHMARTSNKKKDEGHLKVRKPEEIDTKKFLKTRICRVARVSGW